MTDIQFQPWPKIARLNRNIVITEKIDGTNAAVVIVDNTEDGWTRQASDNAACIAVVEHEGNSYAVFAQSRTRFVTPGKTTDNYGFAAWVERNAKALVEFLGAGTHFGEWWGASIQRGYDEKNGQRHFSLFNTSHWGDFDNRWDGTDLYDDDVPGLGVVPVLYEGPFSEKAIKSAVDTLRSFGSAAQRGYAYPEGIVVFHTASRDSFKVTLEGDEAPKGAAGHAKDEERAA